MTRTRGLAAPCSLMAATRSDDACAKATSKRPPGIRSTGRAPTSTTRPRPSTEMERVFDICHGCRRCVSLCQSFPTLFDLVDATADGEVHGVDKEDYWKVVDQCYLCDLCYMTKCPYVPPHPWNVDFPHLMLRAKAIKFRQGRGRAPARSCSPSTDVHGQFAGIPIVVAGGQRGRTGPSRCASCSTGALGVHPDAWLPRAGDASASAGAPAKQRRATDGRRRRAHARARWRSSRPATSTTTSPASATTCSKLLEHNADPVRDRREGELLRHAQARARRPRRRRQAQGRQHPGAGALRAGGLRDPDARSRLHADVQAGAAADVPRRRRRAGGAGRDVRPVRVPRRAPQGRPAEDRLQAPRSARSATTSPATAGCRTSAARPRRCSS